MTLAVKRMFIAVGVSFIAVSASYVAVSAFKQAGYRLAANVSNSLPGYIYIAKNGESRSIALGDLVIFKLPVQVPKIYGFQKGDLFLKQVVCSSGDLITSKEEKSGYYYSCNGVQVASASRFDKYKNPLPHPHIDGVIPNGSYFVTTPHPKSFDSRYYGLIKKEDLIGKAELVF